MTDAKIREQREQYDLIRRMCRDHSERVRLLRLRDNNEHVEELERRTRDLERMLSIVLRNGLEGIDHRVMSQGGRPRV